MSTTTYAPRLHPPPRAPRATDRSGGGRRLGVLAAPVPSRAPSATVVRSFATTSPFAELGPDGRRPRRVVATMLATLAWVPVLALALLAFAVVGAGAGMATAAVWCWRSVSPARASLVGPRDSGTAPDEPELPGLPATAVTPARGRRLVRDRTLGYDL
ncbi:hypothetical protein JN535_06820 [Cellulosimicrobium cellulans]|uniref:hypothetical protein n=1 Tax=Cellulosimicrobium cellulans TaxID=1710 RepID=UPI0019626410|nr:hypothetical protein [Cellulosimicrobium cellulans]MBN0039887.1 hypothetical protein [Cellulosimicrobium cellulans]